MDGSMAMVTAPKALAVKQNKIEQKTKQVETGNDCFLYEMEECERVSERASGRNRYSSGVLHSQQFVRSVFSSFWHGVVYSLTAVTCIQTSTRDSESPYVGNLFHYLKYLCFSVAMSLPVQLHNLVTRRSRILLVFSDSEIVEFCRATCLLLFQEMRPFPKLLSLGLASDYSELDRSHYFFLIDFCQLSDLIKEYFFRYLNFSNLSRPAPSPL